MENSKNIFGKSAYYDPATMNIHVYVDGRHDKDMLRSISHEIVHHHQNCLGDFDGAFEVGEGYAQKSPHLRNMEAEAYLIGNGFMVRDYEDAVKTGDQLVQEWKREDKKIIREQEEPEQGIKTSAEFADEQADTMLSAVKTAMKRMMQKCGADIDTIRGVEAKLTPSNRVKLAVTIMHLFGIDAKEFQQIMGKTKSSLGDLEPMNEKKEEPTVEEKIKNPGKYIDGEKAKAGVDDDGDGVPDGADKDPKDGAVKESIKDHIKTKNQTLSEQLMKKWFKKGDK